MLRFICLVALALVLATVEGVCVYNSANYDTEKTTYVVEMKFYRASLEEWNAKDGTADVAVKVSDAAQSYCSSNAGSCGVTSCCSNPFKDLSVVTATGYPKMDRKDLLLKIALEIPENINATGTPECFVNVEALRIIVGNARQSIYDATGYWITYVGTDFYGIPPNKDLNAIIIPISCVVVLFFFILTIILHFVDKKRQETEKRKKKIADRTKPSKTKVGPTYDIPDEPKEAETFGSSKTQLYKDQVKMSQMKTASIHSEDSAIKSDSEPRLRTGYAFEKNGATGNDVIDTTATQYGHLKPLNADSEVNSPEKKKKKKKKSKSKSKDLADPSTFNEEDHVDE